MGAWAASRALTAAGSNHSDGSTGSEKPGRPDWWLISWATVTLSLPAWPKVGQIWETFSS